MSTKDDAVFYYRGTSVDTNGWYFRTEDGSWVGPYKTESRAWTEQADWFSADEDE
jgi:hypothetical protein